MYYYKNRRLTKNQILQIAIALGIRHNNYRRLQMSELVMLINQEFPGTISTDEYHTEKSHNPRGEEEDMYY